MKKTKFCIILVLLFSSFGILAAQDLELDVHVLPTSLLGDPALFNITVKNMGEEAVQGVEVKITLESGLELSSFNPNKYDFDPITGIWKVGEAVPYKGKVLSIITKYVTKENAIVIAEVTKSGAPDPDSTPGNGVDTNGNGIVVNDTGDEDDGDAAQNGPFN
ncbi:DUF11 domain-containing protein [Flagellimonas algicola]|uniref:DUF11 domain-containing protein n=1 Tax=Flagellimonas algicola TaxID=2583815 RepID=A0ABY2WLY5_9FLAO|nr:DUF11 domain-containing protein [Allomuricauda algicola]TMU55743.1 DUF11 domain-containing protein [Allomuricauda algicola]